MVRSALRGFEHSKDQKKKHKNIRMRAVRFELTHLSIAELKSAALDHSAKLAGKFRFTICLYILIFFAVSTYSKKYKPVPRLLLRFS